MCIYLCEKVTNNCYAARYATAINLHSNQLCKIKKKYRIRKIAYFNPELHKIYGSCIICFAAAYGAVNRVTYKTRNCRGLEMYKVMAGATLQHGCESWSKTRSVKKKYRPRK